MGVDDYRNFDNLSNLRLWAKKDRVRVDDDDQGYLIAILTITFMNYLRSDLINEPPQLQLLTQRTSTDTSGGLSPFSTIRKAPSRSFKLVFKKETPVDPELRKEQVRLLLAEPHHHALKQLQKTVELIKAERKRRLERFNNQKKAETYREVYT